MHTSKFFIKTSAPVNFAPTKPQVTGGYFTINALHLNAQISTECKCLVMLHNFTALPLNKATRARLPWLHPHPNPSSLRSCVLGIAAPPLCILSQRGTTWNCVYRSDSMVNMLF